jgi:uncharacterized membrane protein YfcA
VTVASLITLLVMGILAGAINAAVGSGSLLTLPVLLALGIPPGTAVRTNTIGMSFATVGSAFGYRKEIAAEKHQLGGLSLVVLVCAAIGSCLLLISPPGALEVVVPILIVVALLLVVFQPRIARWLAARRGAARAAGGDVAANARAAGGDAAANARAAGGDAAAGDGTVAPASGPAGAGADVGVGAGSPNPYRSPGLVASMGAASMYGGYFTAAQGILYLGILGAFTGRSMKSVNAVKNFLALIVNITAAIVYLIAHFTVGAEIRWLGVLMIAIGGLIGGYFGSHLTKRLPEWLLRGVIVVVALVALVRQVL